jgi:hypothetical protein
MVQHRSHPTMASEHRVLATFSTFDVVGGWNMHQPSTLLKGGPQKDASVVIAKFFLLL